MRKLQNLVHKFDHYQSRSHFLGFSVAVVPKANAPRKAIEGLTIHAVERVDEAMEVVRGLA